MFNNNNSKITTIIKIIMIIIIFINMMVRKNNTIPVVTVPLAELVRNNNSGSHPFTFKLMQFFSSYSCYSCFNSSTVFERR